MGNAASSMAVILSIKGAANDHHGAGSRGRRAELQHAQRTNVLAVFRQFVQCDPRTLGNGNLTPLS